MYAQQVKEIQTQRAYLVSKNYHKLYIADDLSLFFQSHQNVAIVIIINKSCEFLLVRNAITLPGVTSYYG